jgi:hypothetical protein
MVAQDYSAEGWMEVCALRRLMRHKGRLRRFLCRFVGSGLVQRIADRPLRRGALAGTLRRKVAAPSKGRATWSLLVTGDWCDSIKRTNCSDTACVAESDEFQPSLLDAPADVRSTGESFTQK